MVFMSSQESQQLHERFARKICAAIGMKFEVPQMRRSLDRTTTVDFYSKSDLDWPQKCAACYQTVEAYDYDEYKLENSWYEAGYNFGGGLIPEISYKIPYCLQCFIKRFGSSIHNRTVKAGPSQSNGARVEMCFENHLYAAEFIQANSKEPYKGDLS